MPVITFFGSKHVKIKRNLNYYNPLWQGNIKKAKFSKIISFFTPILILELNKICLMSMKPSSKMEIGDLCQVLRH